MTSAAIVVGLCSALALGGVDGKPPPLVLDVAVDAGLTDRALGAALVQHLRAELSASNVVVATAGLAGAPAANARLTVGPVSGSPRAVSLEIRYLRSDAAVHRTLDLSSLPADGALVAVAVAVDELIRASWSLSGVEATPPAPPVGPAPPASPPAHSAQAEARLLLAGERHSGGTVTLGPDVVLAVRLGARLAVDVRGGWRSAGSRRVADGSIDSTAVTGGVGIAFALPAIREGRHAGAELAARLDGAWLSLHGTARAGATGYGASNWGAAAVGGLGGWVTVAPPLQLVAFAGWQVPLRSVGATDGNQSAGVVYQPGFSAAAGIGARF